MAATSHDTTSPAPRERWRSRRGLVLAMAGGAGGLAGFVLLPADAAAGGGALMLASCVALLLVGVPLAWMEWTIGRRGGALGHSTAPGMLQSLTRAWWARYAGALGVALPLVLLLCSVCFESWTLGCAFQAATGALAGGDPAARLKAWFGTDGGFLGQVGWQGSASECAFFAIAVALDLWILSRGALRGLEVAARIGMPLLLLLGLALLVRSLTLADVDGRSVSQGLARAWTPAWRSLFAPGGASIWFTATGRILLTLSLGCGAIHTGAAALRDRDDVALSALASVALGAACAVVLGVTLVAAAAFVLLGPEGVHPGSVAPAFEAMPAAFARASLPGVGAGAGTSVLAGLWFVLLFVAGLLASLLLSQPALAFLRDAMGLPRRGAVLVLGVLVVTCSLPLLLLPGAFDECLYWAGTVGLVLFASVEATLLVAAPRGGLAWSELQRGAAIRIPAALRPVLTWITPAALLAALGWWSWSQAWPILSLQRGPDGAPYETGLAGNARLARLMLLGVTALVLALVGVASRRGHFRQMAEAERGG